MGLIRIQVVGSFGDKNGTKEFTALTHGHAHAVADALKYLSSKLLPHAVNIDHKLQDEGFKPSEGFRKEQV